MASLADILNSGKNILRGGDAFTALTGNDAFEFQEKLRAGESPLGTADPELTNAPSHALATKQIAERLGPGLASIIGAAQEIPSGLANRQEGKPFFTTEGESGFSLPDLASNLVGARAGAGAAGTSPVAEMIGGAASFGIPQHGPSAGEILGTAASGIGPLIANAPLDAARSIRGALESTGGPVDGPDPLNTEGASKFLRDIFGMGAKSGPGAGKNPINPAPATQSEGPLEGRKSFLQELFPG